MSGSDSNEMLKLVQYDVFTRNWCKLRYKFLNFNLEFNRKYVIIELCKNCKGVRFMRRFRIKEQQAECCDAAVMPETLGGGRFRANKRS